MCGQPNNWLSENHKNEHVRGDLFMNKMLSASHKMSDRELSRMNSYLVMLDSETSTTCNHTHTLLVRVVPHTDFFPSLALT